MLYLGGRAKIDLDNTVYLQSNIILPNMDVHRGGGETYIPIHISDRLTCEGEAIKMDIGFLAAEAENDSEAAPQPIKLVAFDYLNTNSDNRKVDLQASKFLFGKLDMHPTRKYHFVEYSEEPPASDIDHPNHDFFLTLEEIK